MIDNNLFSREIPGHECQAKVCPLHKDLSTRACCDYAARLLIFSYSIEYVN